MSQFIKFYFTPSVLNMFRTLIYPSTGAFDFFILSLFRLCVLVSMCVGVSLWMVGAVSVWQAEACHTDTAPTQPHRNSNTPKLQHIETRTHNECGDTIEKSQAPDDGCINARNMSSIEEVK